MAITAKVRNKQIDTGKVLHALVQGENASGNITFQIIGEEELVEDFASTYFYLLYTRPSDETPNVLLLTNKQLDNDVISVTFKPTSYFTAQDGTVQIQIMATDTEGLSVDSETGTISGSIIWQTFPSAMFVNASQLTGTETIIEENVLTQYLAGMQELYSQTEDAEGDAADYAQLAKDWASKTNGAVEGGEMSAKYYAGTADSRAKEAEGYAVGTVSGSPSASFAGKNAKELASDAQEWAKGTRSDGKTPSHTSDNAKAYAESAADSAAIVSAHAEAIDAIGDDLTNIDAVAADILDDDSAIDAVAENITNVNAVAANETNINAVNTNKTNINTVAGKATEITTVAGIASDVSAVAAIASDVAAVEDIDDDVSAVAAIAVDVGVVADAATDVAAVADGITDVGTVATNISDVSAVAADITKVAAVADDLTNIDAVADDLTNIDAAEANALKAEGYAVGTQNGTPVSGDSPYYENNAKFYGAALPGLQGQVVKIQKQIDNLNQGAGGYPEITYPDATYGTGEVPPNKAKNAQVVNLIMNSRVRNNLMPDAKQSGSKSFSASTSDYNQIMESFSTDEVKVVAGHTYLASAKITRTISQNNAIALVGFCSNGSNIRLPLDNGSVNGVVSVLYSPSASGYLTDLALNNFYGKQGFDSGDSIAYADYILTDLNVYFGGTIPSDASTIAQIQTNYPELLIPSDYDTGTRVDTTYSAMVSKGANILEPMTQTTPNGTYSDGTYTNNTRLGDSAWTGKIDVSDIGQITIGYDSCNGEFRYGLSNNDVSGSGNIVAECPTNISSASVTVNTTGYKFLYMYFRALSAGTTATLAKARVNVGSTALAYSAYHAPQTLTLPEPVTGKSAGSVHQIYYPETGEMTEPLGAVDMGTLSWTCDGTFLEASVTGKKIGINDLLCPRYVTSYVQYATQMVDGQIRGHAASTLVTVKDSSKIDPNKTNAENASAFKSAMDGVILLYELATPNPNSQATDPVIADMIETEGGGRIEAVQTQDTKIDSSFTIGYMNI